MISGIGIDIVSVERIAALWKKHGERFLSRCFTLGEQEYCLKRRFPAEHLAARFAAKEAVAKALPVGFKPGWKDVEVVKGKRGPEIKISGAPNDLGKVWVSLSHEREMAVAMVVISKEGKEIETNNR